MFVRFRLELYINYDIEKNILKCEEAKITKKKIQLLIKGATALNTVQNVVWRIS
jgi:RNA-splicing ligase RtcB